MRETTLQPVSSRTSALHMDYSVINGKKYCSWGYAFYRD